MKQLKSNIKKDATELINSCIDNIFTELHEKYNTSSGDITPSQQFQLDESLEMIIDIVTNQIFYNIDFTKVKLEQFNRKELLELAYTFDWNGSWEDDEEGQEPITKEELIESITNMINDI
jgi:hypothetical protein